MPPDKQKVATAAYWDYNAGELLCPRCFAARMQPGQALVAADLEAGERCQGRVREPGGKLRGCLTLLRADA